MAQTADINAKVVGMLGFCIVCVGERGLAEKRAIEEGRRLAVKAAQERPYEQFDADPIPDDWTSPAVVNGVELPPVFPAVTLAPSWQSYDFMGNTCIGVCAVPCCRELHVAAKSSLAVS